MYKIKVIKKMHEIIERRYSEKNIADQITEIYNSVVLRSLGFSFDGDTPIIDFYSGLIGFNGKELNEDEKKRLKEKLGTKQLSFIEDYLRQKFTNDCDIFHGIPMNKMVINLFHESLIANIVGFYKQPLQVFYHVMYAMIKHLRMSYSDFMKISHNETSILLNFASEENKKIEESSKDGNIGVIGRVLQNAD